MRRYGDLRLILGIWAFEHEVGVLRPARLRRHMQLACGGHLKSVSDRARLLCCFRRDVATSLNVGSFQFLKMHSPLYFHTQNGHQRGSGTFEKTLPIRGAHVWWRIGSKHGACSCQQLGLDLLFMQPSSLQERLLRLIASVSSQKPLSILMSS